MAPEPNDTRVLIPRVRRAVEGPEGAGFAGSATAGAYSDDEINAMIADAIADIILYTGGFFDYTLNVANRDEVYGAPNAWFTEPEMSMDAASVVAAQAALNAVTLSVSTSMKTKESIEDEGQKWSYEISASLIAERIKSLRADRDRALEALGRDHTVADDYINFLAVRDSYTDSLIEPWAFPGGGRGGQEIDPRFG